ncbi:hypothetical protein A9Q86_06805 [Flavobacteriales bacterium 33_180_T64]|nr:hypothetical protein A9Q86_06805 [Flavobacteriales bacterium 33_180_T64]
MKKVFLLLVTILVTVSCKEDKKNITDVKEDTVTAEDGKTLKQSDGFVALQGNFLYVEKDNAAVLQTPTQMYGVIVDDKMKALNKQVQQYKSEPFEMVPVTVRVRVFKNEEATDEWKNKIEIKEVLKVSKPNPEENDIVKLGSK